MGRMKEKPKYRVISFRLDEEAFGRLMKCAESEGRQRGDLARELTMEGVSTRSKRGKDAQQR